MLSAFSIAVAWVVLMLSLAAAASRHAEILNNPPTGVQFTIPRGIAPKSPRLVKYNPQTSINVQKIHGTPAKTNSRSAAAILGAHRRQIGSDAGYQNITSTTTMQRSSNYGIQYSIQVLWDKMPLSLMLDTASSDTWAVDEDFECLNSWYEGEIVYQWYCAFGPPYNGSFQYGRATAPELYMYDRYSDRDAPLFATGPMGYSDITLGNITVTKQLVGLVNRTRWDGDYLVSGVMGLAFPSLTNAYLECNGSSQFNFTSVPRREYSPLFKTMVEQGKSAPMFSMAIDRKASTGLLAWGGVPDLPGIDWNKTASLDMVIVSCPILFVCSTWTDHSPDQLDGPPERCPIPLILHSCGRRLGIRQSNAQSDGRLQPPIYRGHRHHALLSSIRYVFSRFSELPLTCPFAI